MFVFDTNGRVQKVAEGIRFYEQDILCSSYDFSGDQQIELNIDYLMPGFGIALIENDEDGAPISKNSNSYLFKVGINEFRVFERALRQQTQKSAASCIFEPGIKNAHLTFIIADRRVSLIYHTTNSHHEPIERVLGEYKMDIHFDFYRIGFYSNMGNIIRQVTFLGPVPENWRTSIANTIGGRIAFSHNTLTIENCEYAAEVEQPGIHLEPGKYWLKYKKEPVNNQFDIVPYVFPTIPAGKDESEFEDDKKNLLLDGTLLHLKKAMDVTLKFKGRNGRIKNLSLADTAYAEYIETEGSSFYQEGSFITIHLEKLQQIEWKATISNVPEWEDLKKPCPYGIIAQKAHWYSLQDLNILQNHVYQYIYDVSSRQLKIYGAEKEELFNDIIPVDVEDNNTLTIMNNVTMVMTDFVLTTANGSSVNVIVQKTFKHYVPGNIESPIIITRKGEKDVFDLSASYREIVIPTKKIKLFSKEMPLFIKEDIPVNAHSMELYGIPRGSKITTGAKNIQDYATSYVKIPDEAYTVTGNFFTVPQHIRDSYDYLAMEYASIDEFSYEFTNYEREFFTPDSVLITLSKPISKNNGDIIVYGIPKGTVTHDEYLYRVPDLGLINSIDYYADNYEQLDNSLYSVDYTTNQIRMNKNLINKYSHYIIDYLKKDSYVINYRSNIQQYEIDVATDAKDVCVHYDMRSDGGIYKYIHTDIHGNTAKYIVLKREEDDN